MNQMYSSKMSVMYRMGVQDAKRGRINNYMAADAMYFEGWSRQRTKELAKTAIVGAGILITVILAVLTAI